MMKNSGNVPEHIPRDHKYPANDIKGLGAAQTPHPDPEQTFPGPGCRGWRPEV